MGGGKQEIVAARLEEGTSGFSDAGRDAVDVPAFQVQDINLIKGISGFAFTLEDEQFAVRRKIAFAAAPSLEGQLAGLGQETRLALVVGAKRVAARYQAQEAASVGQEGVFHKHK